MSESDQRQPLDYRNAAADRVGLSNRVIAALGGAAISAGVVTFLVAVWVIANLNLGPPPASAPSSPTPLIWKGPAIFTGVALGCLVGIALLAYRRQRFRWFAVGLLIGIGVTALAEGICFGVNR